MGKGLPFFHLGEKFFGGVRGTLRMKREVRQGVLNSHVLGVPLVLL